MRIRIEINWKRKCLFKMMQLSDLMLKSFWQSIYLIKSRAFLFKKAMETDTFPDQHLAVKLMSVGRLRMLPFIQCS